MATITQPSTISQPLVIPDILPLEAGDRLSRDEFERRYDAMPHLRKAELIEGVVYMQAALRHDQHGSPHADMMAWLGYYRAFTPGVESSDNSSVRLDLDNMPQPDASLFIKLPGIGQSKVDEDGYISGAPELVVEISASSASFDLHDKMNAYRRNGVKEYMVWRVLEEEIDWFVLKGGEFVQLEADDSNSFKSEVFPGLWLDRKAMIQRDLATVLQHLQTGIDSGEHAEFVKRLESKEQ